MARPPVHPGMYVKEGILDAYGLTQQELADALNLSRLSVNEIVNGKRNITENTALRLERLTGIDAEVWLDWQRDHDLWHAKQEESQILDRIRRLQRRD